MQHLLSIKLKSTFIGILLSFCANQAAGKGPSNQEANETPQITTYKVGSQSFKMVAIKGGTFYMGAQNSYPDNINYDSTASDREGSVHKVTLSSYSIGQTEVTQGLWKAVMKKSLKWTKENGLNDSMPAYMMSYNEAVEFVKNLNNILHASNQLADNQQFSLPTEAQWEYAARGGSASKHYHYAGSNNPREAGWYDSNSGDQLHLICQKKANELGLYDMSGNVWEWCSDFMDLYSSEAVTDPQGPQVGDRHILRGGGYRYDDIGTRPTCRGYNVANYCDRNLGFRLCMQ